MKNLKAVITNVALMMFSILTIVFMSQAYSTVKSTVLNKTVSESASGFDMIDFENATTSTQKLVAVSNIFVIVFVSLLLVVAVMNLLTSFGVIKNDKLANILHLANVVLAVLALIFAVCALAGLAKEVADANKVFDLVPNSNVKVLVGWGCILNLVLTIAMVVTTVYDFLATRKSK